MLAALLITVISAMNMTSGGFPLTMRRKMPRHCCHTHLHHHLSPRPSSSCWPFYQAVVNGSGNCLVWKLYEISPRLYGRANAARLVRIVVVMRTATQSVPRLAAPPWGFIVIL